MAGAGTTGTTGTAANPACPILALIALVTGLCLTVGITYPLLSVEVENMGYGEAMNGLNAAMTPLGMLVCALFVTRISKHFRAHVFLIGALGLITLTLVLFKVFAGFYVWLLLRFVLGAAVNAIHVVGEPALQALVPSNLRGRVMGIFSGVTVLGYALGPTVLSSTGYAGWLPYVAAATFVTLSAVPLLAARSQIPNVAGQSEKNGEGETSALTFAKVAPALLLAFGAVTIYDNVSVAFIPLFGTQIGLDQADAARLVSVAMVGAVIFQLPIGWLADRFSPTTVVIGCGSLVALGAQLLPNVGTGGALWVLSFLIGGIAFGLQTAVLTELSNRFSGSLLVAGNVAMGVMAGIAPMAGMSATGTAMELLGASGYPAVIGTVFAGIAILYAAKALRSTKTPAPATQTA